VGTRQSTPEAVEQAALEVFADKGFENTTVEDVAVAGGISRRTFFRYFTSKADVPWSGFDTLLERLRAWLAETPDDVAIFDAIAQATIRFNRLRADGPVVHRTRMTLVLHTPELTAHASLRWAEWREVVTEFAARRLGEPIDALAPQLVGHVALGASLAAYERWLLDESSDLEELIGEAFRMVAGAGELSGLSALG
jgi:TetR/AcrR family transcriptional regulator, regulator of mycofactocin system